MVYDRFSSGGDLSDLPKLVSIRRDLINTRSELLSDQLRSNLPDLPENLVKGWVENGPKIDFDPLGPVVDTVKNYQLTSIMANNIYTDISCSGSGRCNYFIEGKNVTRY